MNIWVTYVERLTDDVFQRAGSRGVEIVDQVQREL